MTWKTFTAIWRRSMVLPVLALLFLSADGTKLISEKNKILSKHSQGGQKKHTEVSMKSFSITPNCLEYLVQDKWHEVSNVEWKSVKPEETQQLSYVGNLEKPLPPPFLVLTAQDFCTQIVVSLAICTLTDAFLNHKVDQMVLIDYDGQRRIVNIIFGDHLIIISRK